MRGTDRRPGGERLIKLTLARALKDSGNLGEQVGPIPANSRGAATAAASLSGSLAMVGGWSYESKARVGQAGPRAEPTAEERMWLQFGLQFNAVRRRSGRTVHGRRSA